MPPDLAAALSWPRRALGPRALSAVRRSVGARPGVTAPSEHFRDGRFHNSEPTGPVVAGGRGSMARDLLTKGRVGRPSRPVPLVRPAWAGAPAGSEASAAGECAATWLGHATVLLEVGGHWVLADPVWSERCSPSSTVGPRRSHGVPVEITDLPRLSAVLVSHDHYDHLDTASIEALVRSQDAPFVVPLGIGAHLRAWGVPSDRIVELDWGDDWGPVNAEGTGRDGLRLTCAEARHFSGRFLAPNPTLWSAWLVRAGGRSVFFGGDSGYTAAFARLGAAHGPVDLTVLPVGAYDVRWPDVHLDPEQAVRTHLDVQGGSATGVMLPIHWGTFDLAFHPWAEPADRVRAAAAARDVRLAQPRPGERVDVTAGDLPTAPWWESVR